MPYSRKSPKYSKKNKSQKAGSKTKRVKSQKAGSKTKRVKSQKAGANGNNNKLSSRQRSLLEKQRQETARMLEQMGLNNNSNNESENETKHPCYGNKNIHVEPGCKDYPDFMTGHPIPDQNGLCVRDNCYSRKSLQKGRLHYYIPTQEYNWTRGQQGLEAGAWMDPLTRVVHPRSSFEGLDIPSPESNNSFEHDDEYGKAVAAYLATLKTQQDFAGLADLMKSSRRRFKTAEGLKMERGGK
jgi:hypothetical protein